MTQSDALNILKTGASSFLTGNAGSGKTYLLNRYIEWLEDQGVGYAVTASTGIAATHLGGQTIHSFTGIGIRKYLDDYDLEELTTRKYLYDRFAKIKVLIIDEISMLHSEMFDLVDRVCRAFKDADKPFGGLQIIVSGDFFQLPPIDRSRESLDASSFAYNSNAWRELDPLVCYLSEQHRQNDEVFMGVLNAIRTQTIDAETRAILTTRIGLATAEAAVTRLYAHNEDIDTINHGELEKLADPGGDIYMMTTKGKDTLVASLKKSVLAPERLAVKPGALVMCVKNNYEHGYVNGTLGTVINCGAGAVTIKTKAGKVINISPETWAIEENGKVKAEVSQIPLRLAWAITIHKSQGMSLDSAVIDLSRAFTYGMGYVALSRVRSLDGLFLQGFNEMALSVHPDVFERDENLRDKSELAEQAIQALPSEQLLERHKAFVERAGGAWTDEATLKTIKKHTGGSKVKKAKVSTESETAKLISEGKGVAEVASVRKLTAGTILSHLERLLARGEKPDIDHLKPKGPTFRYIQEAFRQAGDYKLSPVKTLLDKRGHNLSFEDIRIARLFVDVPWKNFRD